MFNCLYTVWPFMYLRLSAYWMSQCLCTYDCLHSDWLNACVLIIVCILAGWMNDFHAHRPNLFYVFRYPEWGMIFISINIECLCSMTVCLTYLSIIFVWLFLSTAFLIVSFYVACREFFSLTRYPRWHVNIMIVSECKCYGCVRMMAFTILKQVTADLCLWFMLPGTGSKMFCI